MFYGRQVCIKMALFGRPEGGPNDQHFWNETPQGLLWKIKFLKKKNFRKDQNIFYKNPIGPL